MSAAQITSYALTAAGVALLGAALVAMFRVRINVTLANTQLVKLAKSGNLERAGKLCKAAPGTYFDAVGEGIAAIPKDTRDRVAIDAALHTAFDRRARELADAWGKRVERGWLGALGVAGGFALAMSSGDGATPPLMVAAGLAGLVVIWIFANRNHVEDSIRRAQEEVLPAIAEAAASSGQGV